MSVPTLSELEVHVGDLIVDPDGVADSTTRKRFINEAYVEWMATLQDRPRLLSAGTSGLVTSSGTRFYTLSVTTIREILGLFRSASGGSTVPLGELEWLEPHEHQEEYEASQALATPAYWTAWRLDAAATAADVGKWSVGFHPTPTAADSYILRVLVEPTALSGSTDKPDVTDVEAYALGRVAAARLALSMGRDDGFIAQLWQGVPERMQAVFRSQEKSKGPRPRPEERPA